MQRLKTCTNRDDEIGLKAESHPTGICACGRTGDTGNPSSRGLTVGFANGRRSPLRGRFTDIAGLEVDPAPVVGNDGKETRLAVNNASATPAKRTDNKDCFRNIDTTPMSKIPATSPMRQQRA